MKKKKSFLFLCFAVFITSMLSPIASNEFVRTGDVHDLVPHIGHVVQAKLALDQGQFPVRTSPIQDGNYGYAAFQFYGSAFYTIVGAVYKFLTPQNPYIALKIVLWLTLLLGTIFFYRVVLLFVPSEVTAFLASILYIMSPYLLINIFERGAIPEAVAQGILPIVLYFNLKIYFTQNLKINFKQNIKINEFIFASLAWFALMGTHTITFVYFSFFLALFLILLTSLNRTSFKIFLFLGLPYLYAILLGCFYFVPMLLLSKYLNAGGAARMGGFQFETLLPTLLSMTPTSPMPLPGNGRLLPGMKLYMSIGLPMLATIGSIFYILFIDDKMLNLKLKTISVGLLTIFLIAFFAAWTPFDFWPYLPKILQIAQFTWRLLTNTMWPGAILFAIAVVTIFGEKLDVRHAIIGFILISISLSPWITSQEVGSMNVADIIKNPDLGYGRSVYLVRPEFAQVKRESVTMPIDFTFPTCSRTEKYTNCNIVAPLETDNIIQLPLTYYPEMLKIKVNGKKEPYLASLYANYYPVPTLKLPRGSYMITSYFQGLGWANWISACAWLLLILYFFSRIFNKKFSKIVKKYL